MFNLSKHAKTTRVSDPVAAGQATTNCTSVDMQGFDAVTFIAAISTIVDTGTVTLHVEQSADNSSFANLAGSEVAYSSTDDNKLAIIEVAKPLERYVRLVIVTAVANGTIDGVVALQTAPSQEPQTNGATVVETLFLHAPAEGTP